jgi:hypothetical protein
MKKQTEKRSKIVIYKVNSDCHSRLQGSCVKWFRYQYSEYKDLLFAIPNGLPIFDKELRVKIYNRLNREGLKAGVPDLFLALPRGIYHGAFIEIKYDSDRLRKVQADMIRELESENYKCIIVRSLEEFIEQINEYMRIR